MGTLVARVDARLAGDEVVVPSAFPTDEQLRLMAHGQIALLAEDRRLTVVAPDRPGLAACVAGALPVNGLDVLAAQAATADGTAVQVYDVAPSVDGEPHWDRVRADVERALAGRLPVASRLAECDLTIRTAKIVTLGHEVVDTFYVVGLDGTKVTDPEHLDAITRQVLAEL